MSEKLNRHSALDLSIKARHLDRERLEEKIFTELQIAQKRGEVLEKVRAKRRDDE